MCVFSGEKCPLCPLLFQNFPSQSCFLETLSSMRKNSVWVCCPHHCSLLPSTVGLCSGCARCWGYIRLHAMVPVLQAKCGHRPTLKKINNYNHNHTLSSKWTMPMIRAMERHMRTDCWVWRCGDSSRNGKNGI